LHKKCHTDEFISTTTTIKKC